MRPNPRTIWVGACEELLDHVAGALVGATGQDAGRDSELTQSPQARHGDVKFDEDGTVAVGGDIALLLPPVLWLFKSPAVGGKRLGEDIMRFTHASSIPEQAARSGAEFGKV